MEKSLSYYDVIKILGKIKVHLVTADNKAKMYFIYRMNRKKRYINFLIHYKTGINGDIDIGHWVGLVIDNKNKVVTFFDSYGRFPDDSLELISKEYRIRTNQNRRDIGEFMYSLGEEGYELRYSEKQYQKVSNNINTCGRWVAFFMIFLNDGGKEENFYEYVNKLKKLLMCKSKDELVVKITN